MYQYKSFVTARKTHDCQRHVPNEISQLIPGARKGALPAFLEPSLALLCDKPPSGPQWIHEIKYEGYRIQARLDGGRVRLLTRKRLDWTACRSIPPGFGA